MKRIPIAALLFEIGSLCLFAGCADVPDLRTVSTFMTSGHAVAYGSRTPTQVFTLQDVVISIVDLQWEPADKSLGTHTVKWNWYSGDKLLSVTEKNLNLTHTPYEIYGRRTASGLGLGHFRVDTLVDDRVVGSSEFDISAE